MTDTEYEKAWEEGEETKEAAPATEAVKAAKKAADDSEQGEFIKAYADLEKDNDKALAKDDEPKMEDKTIVGEKK
jgi:hypothetical protein